MVVSATLHSADAIAERPNFIVIFCDNLGYGDIEPFGSTIHRAPSLTRMATEGRKFTHFCVTAGVCTPSRASLMTGCYAQRVGMHINPRDGHVLRPVSPYGLHPNEVTVAEVLKAAGYVTTIIGKWHLGDQPEFLPTRQGFDSFFGIPYSDDMTEAVGKRLGDRLDGNLWPPLPLMRNERVVEAPANRTTLTLRYTDEAITFIRDHRDRPFFLYLPHAMPGSTSSPFASDAFRGKSQNGPWGDSIEELDASTGRILNELVKLDLDHKTLVVWTSDNGAPLAKDPATPSRGSNLPLHGRGYTTAEGAFRVPTMMWQPGFVPAGTVCDSLATTMDVLPTLASMAGVPIPSDRVIDGHDITPLIAGTSGAESPYERFFYYDRDQLQAVRVGRWKLFVPLAEFARHPHFKKGRGDEPLLFDVVADTQCRHNVASENPNVVSRLMESVEQARQDLGDRDRDGKGQRSRGMMTGKPIALTKP
ncbi:MAG: sulfatase [Planctomycetota bacterium]